jgi:uroporphyrinogen decarboxylase
MNAYERVMNTLQGKPVDRVPVFAVLGAYGGKLTGVDLRTLYNNVEAYVAAQHTVQEALGFDLVLAPFDYSAIAEAFGGEVVWFADQAPNLKRPSVSTAAAVLALPQPDPQRTGRLPFIVESTKQLSAIYREHVPVFAAIPGPVALPALILGLETWLEILLFDEAAAQRLLAFTGEFFVTWANTLLEAGVTALIVTEGMAAAEISQRSLFAEQMLPHIRAVFSQVHGPMVFHHTGGRINPLLDLLQGLPGLAGVVVSSKDDLAEARQCLGPELLLLGNLDNLLFPTTSADEIRERSLACLRTAAPAGPFILANSGADIPLNTPPDNLRAMIAASEAYAVERSSA